MKSFKKDNFKLLDCTLRDGGYYNNWNFSEKIIQKYLKSIETTGIRYVEIGFRFFEEKKIKGLTAYTENKLLKNLRVSQNIQLGIMINAGDLISKNKFQFSILKKLINKNNIFNLRFVRFACHHHEVFFIKKCFRYLKRLNLDIFINIMQISEIDPNLLKRISFEIKKYNIKALYLADSLGALTSKKLIQVLKILNKNGVQNIGIHAHDNLKLALKNSLLAIQKKVKWVDCTITGMGRGPGNLKTEEILKHSRDCEETNEFLHIKKYFLELKKQFKWGTNKYYFYAAKKKIHPTYIQNLLSDKRYSKIEYQNILSSLANSSSKKYNPSRLINSRYFLTRKKVGSWLPKKLINNKRVLILGSGKNLYKNLEKIEKKITHENLFVISLNAFKSIKEKLIDLRVSCHPLRIFSDKNRFKRLKTTFIIPFSSMRPDLKKIFLSNKINFLDYGLKLKNQVEVKESFCSLPSPLALGYSLAISIAGNAHSIQVAGFDGYEKSDHANDQTSILLKTFKKKFKSYKIKSLTKTKYIF